MRIARRLFLASALVAAPLALAHAAGFDRGTFDTARAAGRTVLVDVHADWCPTCRAQAPVLAELLALPAFKDVTRIAVDFDADKDILRELGVRQQSTLIVFKGEVEKARAVGITDPAAIRALLEQGL
jgi:thiol-disulfide isomerase/thioredoxin